MSIIGRKEEIELLHKIYSNKRSDLVAVYGRRRVGKTYLIRSVFKKTMFFEISGLYKGNLHDQLRNFSKSISPKNTKIPTDWFAAFEALEKKINRSRSKNKKVIFIDEFPWLDTPRSKFLTAFEHFWNSFCTKRKDLLVILCGSAASFMIQKILNNKGGLHNRISNHIRLMPFTLTETKSFLKNKGINYTHYDIAKIYMAIGGIPHYLDQLEKGKSVAQNIDQICFSKDGILKSEFERLFVSLFNGAEKHTLIVRILANSHKGITRNEILRKSKLKSGGDFTKKLNELIESGFVEEYNYFGNKNQLSLYRLIDEYSNFYIKFIEPNKQGRSGTWNRIQTKQSYKIWSGFTFENLCMKHIANIKKALGIEGVYSLNSSWFNKNVQIDLLIDRDDNVVNICEMKFYHSSFVIDKKYYQNLKLKIAELQTELPTTKNVFLTLITNQGLKENKYSKELVTNSLKLEDLFIS